MNTGRNHIGKCVVFSVSMIYLFMCLSYIFFLPKRSPVLLIKQTTVLTNSMSSDYKNGNQTTAIEAHKPYKSVQENRRNSVIPKFLTLWLIGTTISVVDVFKVRFSTKANRWGLVYFKARYFYVDHCPLRTWMIAGICDCAGSARQGFGSNSLVQAWGKQYMALILNIID